MVLSDLSDARPEGLMTGGGGMKPRLPLWLLCGGAATGFLVAAIGIVAPVGEALPPDPDAVAVVNGVAIEREDYARTLTGFAADSKNPLTDEGRRWVRECMIEEELLVQRGLDLGLAQKERSVRAAIVRAVITSATAEASAKEPDEKELRAYYEANGDRFTSTPRYRVRAFEFDDAASARAFAARLAEGARAEAPMVAGLPDAALPPAKLRDYIGPDALQSVATLAPGEITAPVATGGGFLVVKLVASEPGARLPFETARDEV